MNSAFVGYEELSRLGGCYPLRPKAEMDNTLQVFLILYILRKRNSLIALLFIQSNS